MKFKNPEIQPISQLALAGAVVVAPAVGLVEMKELMFLGVVLICLDCGPELACRKAKCLDRCSLEQLV